jgi:hypothetical protein
VITPSGSTGAGRLIVVPTEDISTFDRLPEKAKKSVAFWRPLVNACFASKEPVTHALKSVAESHGIAFPTLRKKYYAAKKRGWRGLVNGRLVSHNKVSVAPEFLPYWHGLVLANQRDTKRAFSRFVTAYHRGDAIPGLPPAGERLAKLPRGYGQRNLIRPKYLPPKASIAMARQGIAAARAHLPHGPQDISHIRPLEYVLFDDVELDFLIVVPESPTPVKLRLIVAMDLCSRVILGYGVRPALLRADGVEDGLKLRDMKAVVARLLRTWGCPVAYQMHLICERGTAALPDAAKTALAEISGGMIVVHDTSMVVGQVFEFKDRATGNSWGKAWLESFFGSLHSELQDLPGQKGRRYDLAPAELHGRKQELAQLVRAGKRLPLELRLAFRLPFMTPAEALQELDNAFARLHARRDHNLLCFERAALWRLQPSDAPRPLAELPDFLLDQSERLLWDNSQMESPMERFQRRLPDSGERSAVADCALQRLMEEQKRVRFMDLQFAFERERTDYIYLPPDALLPHLTEGEHYLLWFHPQEMSVVYVTRDRPHLGYVGKLTRFTAGRRGELEDAKAYLREKHRLFAHAQSKAQGPAIDRLRRRGDDLSANTEVINAHLRTLEVEVDVVSGSEQIAANAAPSVQTMTADIADRKNAAAHQRSAARFGAALRTADAPAPATDTGAPATVESWDLTSPAMQPDHLSTEQW